VFLPKELMLVGLATLYDDTDGLNTEEGKAFAYDQYIFREIVKRYYQDEPGFNAENRQMLDSYVKKTKEYLKQLIETHRQRLLAELYRRGVEQPELLQELFVDYKTEPDSSAVKFWIAQNKTDRANFDSFNKQDVKDIFLRVFLKNEKFLKDYKLALPERDTAVAFFSGVEPDLAQVQKDEIIIYTKVPEKMLLVAEKLTQLIPSIGKRAQFGPEEYHLYRRLAVAPPVFSREESGRIKTEYAEHEKILKKIFFINDDGTLALKKEIEYSEHQDIPDIDIVIDIMLRYRWRNSGFAVEELKKKEPQQYRGYLNLLFDQQAVILKYPCNTVTSRKRQLMKPLQKALELIAAEN
jgi:hypothetical protein